MITRTARCTLPSARTRCQSPPWARRTVAELAGARAKVARRAETRAETRATAGETAEPEMEAPTRRAARAEAGTAVEVETAKAAPTRRTTTRLMRAE